MSDPQARRSLANVSRETAERLDIYASLLEKWNPRINLVAKPTLKYLWSRHILDSLQLFNLAAESATSWADLGSGGGFPGLVVAIQAAERWPQLRLTLVESDQRKAVFLQTVMRETGIEASVVAERIEAVAPLNADVISARALAPLPVLLSYAERHLASGGTALFPKGAGWRQEVKHALEHWRFRCEDIASQTSSDGAILRLGEIERV